MPTFSPSRILRAVTTQKQHSAPKWSETLALPRSAFPARPTPADIEKYRQKCADDLYTWQRTHRNASGKEKDFILHDGPPYANGAVHVGHALNKVLKDLILRWQLSQGRRVHYRPGWDCHGLPIELKALQAQRTQTAQAGTLQDAPKEEAKAAAASHARMSASEVRNAARELASATIEVQKQSFRGWGVMGEWHAPYKTMSADFEIQQLEVFKAMVQKGLISRHRRPVYWSPSSRTALAEAELEYDDNHKCTAAFVKMAFVRLPKVLENHQILSKMDPGHVSALIWTTTPWTLPANQAIAVNPGLEYTVVSIEDHLVLVAKDRIEHVLSFAPEGTVATTIVETVSGGDLADGQACCFNVFQGHESPILKADFVTAGSGTGVVHMAPGHGMEDYVVCREHGIDRILAPVDEAGSFTEEAFPAAAPDDSITGLDAQTTGVDAVLRILRDPARHVGMSPFQKHQDMVFATHTFTHKNPIDWRTKQPVIVRATAQWFADVSAIKERALSALNGVKFIPESGKTRLRSFIEGRSQWCISRQRAWGVPIPALYHKSTGEACITETSIDHIISVIKERGTDAWFSDPPDERVWIHQSLQEDTWTRGTDTMDVWFDSGTTWTTLNGQRADVYIEGTDQHRGWFQSSLLTFVATHDELDEKPAAPYKTLITHGFTLDAKGSKMSKSLGNVISPEDIMNGSLLPPLKAKKSKNKSKNPANGTPQTPQFDAMGPDVLRLWVASSDYTRDVSISIPVLQSVQQALQKYRVTFKFLLGVVNDYAPQHQHTTPQQPLPFADRAILHRLSATSANVHAAYAEYKFHKAVSDLNTFVSADLSAFYFEIIKDGLYAGSASVRRRTQGVLHSILTEMLAMLAPVTPHLVAEVWALAPEEVKGSSGDPLRRVWDVPFSAASSNGGRWGLNGTEQKELEVFTQISSAVKIAQETARVEGKLGSGLACKVELYLPDATPKAFSDCVSAWEASGELADSLVVSSVRVGRGKKERPSVEWYYEQEFDIAGADGEGYSKGTAIILPPDHRKCVRCWRYTADTEEEPCGRCGEVLEERNRHSGSNELAAAS